MTSQPTIPSRQPLVQSNPLVNPLRDMSGRRMSTGDLYNDRLRLQEEQKKQQEEEFQKRIEDYKKNDRQKMLRDLNNPKEFMFVGDDYSDNGIAPLWEGLSDSSGHKSEAPLDLWGEDALVPKQKDVLKPTPKKSEKSINIEQKEEEKHEPPNQYVKDTRGRKTLFSDDDNKKYLNKDDYRELVRLENEFRDGLFNSNSIDYNRLKKLRTTRSNNKKSGKTF